MHNRVCFAFFPFVPKNGFYFSYMKRLKNSLIIMCDTPFCLSWGGKQLFPLTFFSKIIFVSPNGRKNNKLGFLPQNLT